MTYEAVIGLEVHVQLMTKTKLFSAASTQFGAMPNAHVSLIDLGLPGTLPVINEKAIIMAIQFGYAIGAKLNDLSTFERKNYFYPDLPKGYQISQFFNPIVCDGQLDILLHSGQTKTITIQRAHLEEDAGKSIHDKREGLTGIDLNRAGTPLLEIVTTPCMHSAFEAVAYLKKLHQLVRFIGICDGNMQEGSFRADVNISLRPKGSKTLGVKTELKNLNSFRYIEQAIEYEIERQTALLEQGKSLEQETRTFLPKTQKTRRMRVKENENDYRYFRDPDLLPIHLTKTLINTARSTLPPLPEALQEHLFTTYQLELPEIDFLLTDPHLYQYFECTQKETLADAKSIVNWLKGPLRAKLNDLQLGFNQSPMRPASLAQLLNAIKDTKITTQQAKNIFNQFWEYKTEIDILIERLSHENSFSESTLEKIMLNIFEQYPAQVLDLKNGKDKLLGFFIGLVMRETKGNANPEVIHQILQTCLEKVPSP